MERPIRSVNMPIKFPGQPNSLALPHGFGVRTGNPGGGGQSFVNYDYQTGLHSPKPPNIPLQCTSAAIPLQTRNGAVQTTPSLFQGAGFFAQRFTFAGLTGQTIALWARSAAFDTFITLARSSGAVVAQDHASGYKLTGDVGASAIVTTLPANDTYTFEVSSFVAGATGAFYASWSSGRNSPSFTPTGSLQTFMYEPSQRLIWVCEADRIERVDPVTMTLVDTLAVSAAPRDIVQCASNGRIFVQVIGANLDVWTPLGVLIGTTPSGNAGLYNGLSADPLNNRVWIGTDVSGGPSTPTLFTIDASSLALTTMATQGQTGITLRTTCNQLNGVCYVSTGVELRKVAVPSVVTSVVPTVPSVSNRITYIPSSGIIYMGINDGSPKWIAFNPSTDTVLTTQPATFNGCAASDCSGLVYMALDTDIILVDLVDRVTVRHAIHQPSFGTFSYSIKGGVVIGNGPGGLFQFPSV